MKLKVVGATFVACLLATSSVWAGGYDTPMLYTARHVGMGGAAVSYVNDPSALFHNPAGLARVKKLSLMADFTFLLAGIKSAPDATTGALDSDTIKAPFFLIGGAYRVTDFLVLGLGVYPVASASASYSYGTTTENSTTLVFLETALGAAVNIDAANLTIGASYRITYVSLSRKQAFDNGSELLNFDMKGWNFAGFRLGVQWAPLPKYLTFGFSYRHQTTTEVTADEVTALALKITNGSTEFTLPSRLILACAATTPTSGSRSTSSTRSIAKTPPRRSRAPIPPGHRCRSTTSSTGKTRLPFVSARSTASSWDRKARCRSFPGSVSSSTVRPRTESIRRRLVRRPLRPMSSPQGWAGKAGPFESIWPTHIASAAPRSHRPISQTLPQATKLAHSVALRATTRSRQARLLLIFHTISSSKARHSG